VVHALAAAVGCVLLLWARAPPLLEENRSHQKKAAALSMKINGSPMLKCFATLFCMLSCVGAKPIRGNDTTPMLKGPQTLLRSAGAGQHGLASMLDMGANAYHERFQPQTLSQYYAAVATMWNLLDRNIEVAARNCRDRARCPGTPFGYMRPAQLKHYSSFVWKKGAMTYCEIGFNGGHGTTAMLLANPKLRVHSFELGGYTYTAPAEALVRLYFGERFKYHRGDSQKLVPAFARNNSKLCDVLLVDGAHSYAGALKDIRNMHALAQPGAVLLVDDLDEGPGPALEAALASGLIEVIERFMFNESTVGDPVNPCIRRVRMPYWNCKRRWGWAAARYI